VTASCTLLTGRRAKEIDRFTLRATRDHGTRSLYSFAEAAHKLVWRLIVLVQIGKIEGGK
jgi:hypothetical protein